MRRTNLFDSSFTTLPFYLVRPAPFAARWAFQVVAGPREWRPEAVERLTQAEFWQTLGACLGKLPDRIAAAFTLREMDELGTEEICRMLAVAPSNLWVMLHRARMALRECLEVHWFDQRTGGEP